MEKELLGLIADSIEAEIVRLRPTAADQQAVETLEGICRRLRGEFVNAGLSFTAEATRSFNPITQSAEYRLTGGPFGFISREPGDPQDFKYRGGVNLNEMSEGGETHAA